MSASFAIGQNDFFTIIFFSDHNWDAETELKVNWAIKLRLLNC